jgi:S1-C subfamily serine protease
MFQGKQHQLWSQSMQMQSTHLTSLSADGAAIAKQAAQSAVAVRDRGRWFSGFYWQADVVVSASELLRPKHGATVALVSSSQELEGSVIGRDPSTDVALIRVPAGAQPVAQASSPQPALGEIVLAAGRTRHGVLCSVGQVALSEGPWRSMYGGDITARVWLDLRLLPEGEGSAVFNALGQFIGMAVHGPRRRVLLIPAATIERVGGEVLAHGRVRRAYLGVGVQAVAVQGKDDNKNDPDKPENGDKRRTGLMIISLDPDGPAAQAGLRQGDIILAFDGKPLSTARVLIGMLRSAGIAKTANLDVRRAGDDIKVEVALGEGPPV